MRKLVTLTAIAITASTFISGSASAASRGADGVQAHVRYSDLNLASAAGQDTLQKRLDRAVEQVCGKPSVSLLETRSVMQCRERTMNAAQAQVQVASRVQSQGDSALGAMH